MADKNLDVELLTSTIDHALDGLMHVRVLVGDVSDVTAPTEALDAALVADPSVQQARRASLVAMQRLRDRLGMDGVDDVLLYEDAVNACTSAACDVAFRLGVQGRRPPPARG